MKNKDKRLFYKLLIATAIIIPLIIGFSYAYFMAVIRGTENPTTISGSVVSEFLFDIETENDGYINATNIIPINDSQKEEYASIGNFKVTTGANDYKINYNISLTDITITNNLKNTDFKWQLVCTSCSELGEIKNASGDFSDVVAGTDKVLKSDIRIDPSSEDEYKLYIWVQETDEDQIGVMNQSFSAKVKVTGGLITATIPDTFQQIEYIESTGTQYIDTGITPTSTTDIEVTFMNASSITSNQRLFGQINTAGNNRYQLQMNGSNNKSWVFGIGNTTYGVSLDATTSFKTLKFVSGTGLYVNGSLVQSTSVTETNAYTIWLFRGYTSYSKFKISSASLWQEGVLVRNFIPCYRKADNTVGLYETVQGAFYTNIESRKINFTAGPNVN